MCSACCSLHCFAKANMLADALEDLTLSPEAKQERPSIDENGGASNDSRQESYKSCSTSEQCLSEYMCYFMHRTLSFRQAEVEALASSLGIKDLHWRLPQGNDPLSPFYFVRLPSEAAAKEIATRSVLIKGIYEIWGEGTCWHDFVKDIRAQSSKRIQAFQSKDVSWKIIVDSLFHTLKHSDQLQFINDLAFLNFKGNISLDNPDEVFRLMLTTDAATHGLPEKFMQKRFYFGREIGTSNRSSMTKYSLPQRSYIGPTSMDTEMAFLMCNMAKVQRGSLVYDPFAGTGSILIAAAHLQAVTLGADIDIRVIREGKIGKNGEVLDNWTNFRQYGLPPPAGLLRMDAHTPAYRLLPQGFLDAVVCDPPYGVRAGGRRSLSEKEILQQKKLDKARVGAPKGFPPTIGYTLTECLQDLLDFSAKHLCIQGRLVYFLPAIPDTCVGSDVPQHPALCLISNCEQILTGRYSRRLITMEKIKEYDKSESVPPISPEIEENLNSLSANVYEVREEKASRPKFRSKLT